MPRSAGSSTDDDVDPISSLIIKKPKKSGRKQTSRKTRTKTRKPKYLSLRLQFSTTERSPESSEMPSSTVSTTTSCTASDKNSGSKQLELFPLHPENLVEEKEAHDENMAYLFSVADGGASTLTGLLESAITTSSSDQGDNNNNNNDRSGTTTLSPSSASLTYTYAGGRREDQEEVALVRTALRNKEREPSEERWVHYSEVVERRDDQEVSSCAAPDVRRRNQRLSLKLDYEEILSAWSDKGSLFIHAYTAPQSPQTVPDIHDDLLASQIPNVRSLSINSLSPFFFVLALCCGSIIVNYYY